MSYPPGWRAADPGAAPALMRANPIAHFVTGHGGLNSTRIPMLVDLEGGGIEGGEPVRLRGHLNARNPQCEGLDGAEALVTFDGPAAYVSPNWRTEATRAGTIDYEEVQVRGRVRVVDDIDWFRDMIDDMAALIEPQHPEIGDYPVWRTTMAPAGYVERLYPAIVAFTVEITSLRMIAKLHQSFPEADRLSVAEHLGRSHREQPRAVAQSILRTLKPE
ncbi:MAG: FMN-binding negative transcriptional regulator [Oceanicaulis sp.]